jgi:hypothetical protein
MRILTGGHAIWMGGWSPQIHHHRDFIETGAGEGLKRPDGIVELMLSVAVPTTSSEEVMLPPHYALADGLIYQDHAVMPPDEIDPDYLDQDERPALRTALAAFGLSEQEIDDLVTPYEQVLSAEHNPHL